MHGDTNKCKWRLTGQRGLYDMQSRYDTEKRQKPGVVTELCGWRCLSVSLATALLPSMTQ